MKRKIKLAGISMTLLLLCVAVLFGIGRLEETSEEAVFSEDYIMAEELPELLCFTHYDKAGWEQEISEIVKGRLNYGELEDLLEKLSISRYVTYEKKNGFSVVPRAVFFQVYAQAVELLDMDGRMSLENRIFLQEDDTVAGESWWYTQKGRTQVKGGNEYLEKLGMYQVYLRDGAVAGITGRITEPLRWENVFVDNAGEGVLQVIFEKKIMEFPAEDLQETIEDTICDIQWQEGRITGIYKKEATIQGTVLSYDDNQIEIEGYGILSHSGDLKIYKTYGVVEQLDVTKLSVGNLMADFVVAENEICGMIIQEPAEIKYIRVLLLNGESPYYPELYVKSDAEVQAVFGELYQNLDSEAVVKASDFWELGQNSYLRVDPVQEDSRFYLTDESGAALSLGYPGSYEIRRYDQGYAIVNVLPLEDYLCGVVCSEMPASYEMEALRAQAVCARSYACIQLAGSEYARFGANVDDSTNYQVYNKQEMDERTNLAVRDTVGEVIMYQGEIAEAYYYSTSCGLSQNGDVWGLSAEDGYGYLRSISLLTGAIPAGAAAEANVTRSGESAGEDAGEGRTVASLDLSEEESFETFITDESCTAFDSDARYFRWEGTVDLETYRDAVYQAALERQSVISESVQMFDTEGNPWEQEIVSLGTITGLEPEERSQGGVLQKLRIYCEGGSILLSTEYTIRKVLAPALTSLTDKDGEPITGFNLLPSAAFVVTSADGGYKLRGGGYGHGIGLSQNGANGMAMAGYGYIEILQTFYTDITIQNIYQ